MELLERNGKYVGAMSNAIKTINKFNKDINSIIEKGNASSYVMDSIDLGNDYTNSFNEDLESVFLNLESMAISDNKKGQSEEIKRELENVIEAAIIKFQKLDFFVFYSAFLLNGQPIVDIFYKTYNNKTFLRPPKEFALIVGSNFIAMFYKVTNMYLL